MAQRIRKKISYEWNKSFTMSMLYSASHSKVSATRLFSKPPLAILNGTSNPIGLHNEHSLFQRISIHLHYDMKASKHLASLLMTIYQRERNQVAQPSLFVLPTSLFEFPKNTTAFHYRYDMQNVLYFCSFCKPTFSGATFEWDALYLQTKK
jgi:hypothetical protein